MNELALTNLGGLAPVRVCALVLTRLSCATSNLTTAETRSTVGDLPEPEDWDPMERDSSGSRSQAEG